MKEENPHTIHSKNYLEEIQPSITKQVIPVIREVIQPVIHKQVVPVIRKVVQPVNTE